MHAQNPRGPDGNGVRRRRRPQPSMIVAIIALVAATGGTATALPGRNTVDRNDISKNAIRSKSIKDGQVTGADLRDGTVTSADIADGTIAGSDLARAGITGAQIADRTVAGADLATGAVGREQIARRAIGGAQIGTDAIGSEQIAEGVIDGSHVAPMEPFHLIGTPGEPQFFDGGEGDCVWSDGLANTEGLAPSGFAKDAFGRVSLQGVATATDGPGGDGRCNASDPGEAEDGLVFALPPSYRPAYFDLSGLAHQLLIAPDEGAEFSGTTIPPGGVYSALNGNAALDGVSIRAASGAAGSAGKPADISPKGIAELAR